MRTLTNLIRWFLAKHGYLLFRVFPDIPPTLEEYLRNLTRRGLRPDALFCFDNEAQIQAEILSVFSTEMVAFLSILGSKPASISDQCWALIEAPDKRCLVEIDADAIKLDQLSTQAHWVFRAEIVILRASLGFFWSGNADLCRLSSLLQRHGLFFYDVLGYARPDFFKAPLGRVILVFERTIAPNRLNLGARQRRHRTNEALAYLSAPIAQSHQLQMLAGRGSFGFPAGVFNPGAVAEAEKLLLLCRGECLPWVIQKTDESLFFSNCRPLFISLNKDHAVDEVAELSWLHNMELNGARLEDFRLFHFQNQLLTNHSVVTVPHRPTGRARRLRMQSLRTRVGISRVDLQDKKLAFLGFPQLDRALSEIEKNWAVFPQRQDLYIVYSFSPYRLLRATRWPAMVFETVVHTSLTLRFEVDRFPIRNSINPVDYDDDHFLHVVHQVYPNKHYVFWAVLIDKSSLLPSMVSSRPLIRGWHSAPAAIIYASSVVVREAEVLLFAGFNDSSTGFWRIPRSMLDQEWLPLTA